MGASHEGSTRLAVIPGDLRSRSGRGSRGKGAPPWIPFPVLRAAGDDGENRAPAYSAASAAAGAA